MISALILQLLQSCCRTDENNLVRAANEILNQEESVRVNVGDEIQPVADAASSSTAMEQDGDNKEAPTAQQRYQKVKHAPLNSK